MITRFTKRCLSLMISSLLLLPAVNSHAGETTRVNIGSAGMQGNSDTDYPSISADGRIVAFTSAASNLVAGDTNGYYDIFVHDRTTSTTTRVSVDSAGQQANASSLAPAISADGRFVAFNSGASNLVAGDNNGANVFVHDLTTGTTTRIDFDAGMEASSNANAVISADGRFVAFNARATLALGGNELGNVFLHDRATGATTRVTTNSIEIFGAYVTSISDNGRFVAFSSGDPGHVAEDTNFTGHIFVYDRITATTTIASLDSSGLQGNGGSSDSDFSADGRFVAFESGASNLVAGDTNESGDIFVRDRSSGITTRVSVDSAGLQGNDDSIYPAISADGRLVTFLSDASNLVPEDTNGAYDVFVHDRSTATTTRIKAGSMDRYARHIESDHPDISADGRFVAFSSGATGIVEGDTNGEDDIFVRDRLLVQNKTADLQLAVTSQPASVQAGQTASYTYTLTNNGPDSINTEVKLTDVISEGRVISLTPSQGNCKKAAVSVCRFGSLPTGASVTLTADIKAGSDPLTQQLSVNAPPVDNVPDNNSITVSTPVTP